MRRDEGESRRAWCIRERRKIKRVREREREIVLDKRCIVYTQEISKRPAREYPSLSAFYYEAFLSFSVVGEELAVAESAASAASAARKRSCLASFRPSLNVSSISLDCFSQL